MRRRALALFAGLVAGFLAMTTAGDAQAQAQGSRPPLRRKRPATETPAPAPLPQRPPDLPQEKPLAEISETLGSLAFLAQICTPELKPNPWQRRMEALLDAEGENSSLRERMIGAYNQGFGAYSTTYRRCTESALAARRVLTLEAARLAREIERRFGI